MVSTANSRSSRNQNVNFTDRQSCCAHMLHSRWLISKSHSTRRRAFLRPITYRDELLTLQETRTPLFALLNEATKVFRVAATMILLREIKPWRSQLRNDGSLERESSAQF